jgi:uncharacterized protein
MQYYHGKSVLITGASSGIGTAFCHELAGYGASLMLAARRKDRLDSLANELLDKYECEVSVFPCDLSDPGGPESLVRAIRDQGLSVDILINNAGFGFNGSFLDGSPEKYQQMMQVNMGALVTLTRLLLPDMVRRGSGGILNVSSMAGFLPIPYFAVYSATKQFVINISWSLWKELQGTGVHVSVLCPGPVDTEFMEVAGVDRKKAAFRGLQSPESTALRGLRGLAENAPLKLSRSLLRIPYLLSKWVPVRLGLLIGGLAMKK